MRVTLAGCVIEIGNMRNGFNFDGESHEKWRRWRYYGNHDQKQAELVQDYLQWQVLVPAVLKLQVLHTAAY
jgi:hypothetical protein